MEDIKIEATKGQRRLTISRQQQSANYKPNGDRTLKNDKKFQKSSVNSISLNIKLVQYLLLITHNTLGLVWRI